MSCDILRLFSRPFLRQIICLYGKTIHIWTHFFKFLTHFFKFGPIISSFGPSFSSFAPSFSSFAPFFSSFGPTFSSFGLAHYFNCLYPLFLEYRFTGNWSQNKTDTVITVGLNTFVITSKLCPNYDIITFYLNIFI